MRARDVSPCIHNLMYICRFDLDELHDGRGREHFATVSPSPCLSITMEKKLTNRCFIECVDDLPPRR
jgi:hypothetical protein